MGRNAATVQGVAPPEGADAGADSSVSCSGIEGATPGINPGGGGCTGSDDPLYRECMLEPAAMPCELERALRAQVRNGEISREEADRRLAEHSLDVLAATGVFAGSAVASEIAAARFLMWLRAYRVAKGIDASVIRQIKALPDGARLTSNQVSQLSQNIDAILAKSLPAKAASGRVQDVVDLFKTDRRFRFLDQVPGARERINEALKVFGASL